MPAPTVPTRLVVVTEDSAGSKLYYTGRGGALWLSLVAHDAFVYTGAAAQRKAEAFNKLSGTQHFRVENAPVAFTRAFDPEKLHSYIQARVDGKWFKVSYFAVEMGMVWLCQAHGVPSGFVDIPMVELWEVAS